MAYECYTQTSKNYDLTRQPIGLSILLGCFATVGRTLADLVVLDAGCGTGSYAIELQRWVKRIEGVDATKEMVAQAKTKAEALQLPSTRLSFQQSRIEKLPFDDAQFDCVMVNQVLHHLDDDSHAGFPQHRETLNELHRVMRVGGVLVINTCSTTQLHGGWWYRELFSKAFDRLEQRLIPLPRLVELLEESGFSYHGNNVPTDAVFQGEAYFEPTGLLKEEWRHGDSVFALATHEELENACARIRQMKKDDSLEDYVSRQDARRPHIGQVTFVHAVKKP